MERNFSTSFLTFRFGSSSTGVRLLSTCRLNGNKSSFLMVPGKPPRHLKAAARTLGGLYVRSVHAVSNLNIKEDTCSLRTSADSLMVTRSVSIVAALMFGSCKSSDCRRRGKILGNSARITFEGTLGRIFERAIR